MSKVVQFEPFKHAKQWDEDYPKFLGNVERFFGANTDPEEMCKRLYYATRYLEGVSRSFLIFKMLGIPNEINKKGKQYMVDWLKEILKNLEE